MGKIHHARSTCDKAKAVAIAAFLGDSGWIHTTIGGCCGLATFCLPDHGGGSWVLWTTMPARGQGWAASPPRVRRAVTSRTSSFRRKEDDAIQRMESSMTAQTISASGRQSLAVWGFVLGTLLVGI